MLVIENVKKLCEIFSMDRKQSEVCS